LKGGDTGPAAELGKSAESLIVTAVSGLDPDTVMPKKGTKWTAEQVGLLRAWIDQGAVLPAGITFAKPPPENLHPHVVALPPRPNVHPLDHLVGAYFAEHRLAFASVVDDRTFARRAYLDLIGLLPTPEQLDAFLQDSSVEKRAALVRTLLADRRNYTEHWLSFWNDLLRNDYKGAGFIDGGRKQVSGWLYAALRDNKPYDRFVAELMNPTVESEGFSRGIIWRGNVNASMLPPMQAAQNISQVFLGVNLKCASCHDSFVNDWSLADAYGLAAIYADTPLELVHCDKPTGKKAAMRFLYPEMGSLDAQAAKPDRLKRLAEIVTSPQDGRLARTLVNRLWARLFGRGLVEPLDDMDKPAWNRDLLDWLAEDFIAHGSDVKHTLEMICTSRVYQLPTVEGPREKEEFVFRGPLTRRLSAEQITDAVNALTGEWPGLPSSLEFDLGTDGIAMPKWIWTDEPVQLGPQRNAIRAAQRELGEAKKKLDEAQANGEEAVKVAAAGVTAAQEKLDAANQLPPPRAPGEFVPGSDLHHVVFRHKITFKDEPIEAYGTVLASQYTEVRVNGLLARPVQRDGFRNGRIALLDLRPLLIPGDNEISVDAHSHTSKSMNDAERQKYPASLTHLNAVSGVSFYLRCVQPGGKEVQELVSDTSWRVQRNPEGQYFSPDFADDDWKRATALPEGVAPVDEGPGLEPVTRQDFANIPVVLGSQVRPAVSTAAHAGHIRASLLAADPLQVALDRPNREVVVPARATAATTLQALELTNGTTLDVRLQDAATKFFPIATKQPDAWIRQVFSQALSRPPSADEQTIAREMLGQPVHASGLADLLWTLVNHPEFQLIN